MRSASAESALWEPGGPLLLLLLLQLEGLGGEAAGGEAAGRGSEVGAGDP